MKKSIRMHRFAKFMTTILHNTVPKRVPGTKHIRPENICCMTEWTLKQKRDGYGCKNWSLHWESPQLTLPGEHYLHMKMCFFPAYSANLKLEEHVAKRETSFNSLKPPQNQNWHSDHYRRGYKGPHGRQSPTPSSHCLAWLRGKWLAGGHTAEGRTEFYLVTSLQCLTLYCASISVLWKTRSHRQDKGATEEATVFAWW